jgi:hypothetical protein
MMTEHSAMDSHLSFTWRPTLLVTGLDGLPSCQLGGNVSHSKISMKLSIRLPPTANPKEVLDFTVKELTRDPPYNAKVYCSHTTCNMGWNATDLPDSL